MSRQDVISGLKIGAYIGLIYGILIVSGMLR